MLGLLSLNVYGQEMKDIAGTVLDENGEPLAGVTILLKGSSEGTTSDADGNFVLDTDKKNPVLVFSFLGMETKEMAWNGREKLRVIMETEAMMLDEVVAIGYVTMNREDLTGAVSSLRGQALANVPVADVSQALAGRIAGVQVISASGALDADISVRVRGGISISQDNSPLYIIDGIPFEDGLGSLSASDIASIDVLKDASATAIYGSRGANGIVVVTTKSGKADRVKVSYEMYYGFKKLSKRLDVMDAADFVALEYERTDNKELAFNRYGAFYDISANYPAGSGVDWQERVFGQAVPVQMHRVSLSGGNSTANFLLSYTHNDEEGIMANSDLKNDALRLKFGYNASKKLKLSVYANYSSKQTRGSGSMESSRSVLRTNLTYRPTGGLNVSDEDLIGSAFDPLDPDEDANWRNPIVTAETEERTRTDINLQLGGTVKYNIMKGLDYTGNISYRKRQISNTYFAYSGNPRAIREGGPYGTVAYTFSDNIVFSNTLSYSVLSNRKHRLKLLAGQEYIWLRTSAQSFGARGFPDDNFGLDDLGLGSDPIAPQSSKSMNNQLSFFLRGDYQFKGRYLFSAVVRADGSSKFGKNNRWGVFPSASAAWVISKEPFMANVRDLSTLKLRLSYGAVGNCKIDDYRSLDLMNSVTVPVDNTNHTGYATSQMANPDLKWETNITANLGVDIGFLNDRISMNIDAYHVSTKDLLFETDLPYTSGFESCLMNIGSTEGCGVELSLNSMNIMKRNFSWTTSFNIATSRTVVKALDGAAEMVLQSRWNSNLGDGDYIVKVGSPVGLMYGYEGDGIYKVNDFIYDMAGNTLNERWKLKDGIPHEEDISPQPGHVRLKDRNNDGVINTKDKTVIGNANPLFYGGLTNTFSFYGVDLSVFFNFTYGNDVYNATRMAASDLSLQNRNGMKSAFEGRFVTVDESGANIMDNPVKLAAANRNATKPSYNGRGAAVLYDEYIEDGSFLRLNNITLGYTFPKKWMTRIYVDNLRIYASAYNILTVTGYSGYDPEVGVIPDGSSVGNMTPGLDWGAHPRAFSIVLGLNLTF